MQITLTPLRSDDVLTLWRKGDILTINGEDMDLTRLPEGATLPREAVACSWLVSDIERSAGVLRLTLVFPHSVDAPLEARFPAPLILTEDGPVALPQQEVKNEN